MDGKRVRSISICYLVVGLLAVQASASFKSCYESCFIICLFTPNNSAFSCSFKCLKDCIIGPPSLTQTSTTSSLTNSNKNFYFCKLGCASSLCVNLSSKTNPRSEKVKGCVSSCSETCTMN